MEITALIIQLFGPTLARAIFAALLKDNLETDFIESGDIAETLGDSVSGWGLGKVVDRLTGNNFMARHNAEQAFPVLGSFAAQKLLLTFERQKINLTDAERREVLEEVAAAINKNAVPLLIKTEFNADRFARRLEQDSKPTFYFTNPAQLDLFKQLLRISAELVFAVSDKLPTFNRDTTAALLQDTSDLLRLGRKGLDDLERIWQEVSNSADSQTKKQFETRYRRLFVSQFDRLHLFGVDLMKNARQPLTVAFIKLRAKLPHDEGDRRALEAYPADEMQHATPKGARLRFRDGRTVSAAKALTSHKRILVTARAGYGKTTLLKWAGVQVANASTDDELAAWKGRNVFFVQLRHFTKKKLPNFTALAHAHPELAPLSGKHSRDWTEAQLNAGRAIVLLDGMDEINAAKREQTCSWIEQLVIAYPETIVVVSSRPYAVDQESHSYAELHSLDFCMMELQKIEAERVEGFVKSWHMAMGSQHSKYPDKTVLPKQEARLLSELKRRKELQSLAETPLLCAMLCALNLSDSHELPLDRIQLYTECVELLLGRDGARGVGLQLVAQA